MAVSEKKDLSIRQQVSELYANRIGDEQPSVSISCLRYMQSKIHQTETFYKVYHAIIKAS